MVGHLRIKSPWSQLAVFIGLTCLAYLVAGIATLIIYKFYGIPITTSIQKLNWSDPNVVGAMKTLQALSSILIFLFPVLLFAIITFNGNYGYFLGFKKAEKGNMYVLSIICIILALPIVFWLGQLNSRIQLPAGLTDLEKDASEQMEAFLKVNNTIDIIKNLAIIALLPAICEELYFRAGLQRILIHITKHPLLGIVLTGILFSALHLQFEGFLPRVLLGTILGFFYWYSGSIWTSIVAHFVHNAVQVLVVSYMPKFVDKNPDTPVLAAMASAIAVWAILWFYQRQSTITWSKVYKPNDLTPNNQFLA
jgi:membrane protease YdiL (CAAX protease family)